MATVLQDVRYAARILRKSSGFTVVVVLTLALGIGANVAIFSYVDELWLRPLPVPQAGRIVRIFTSNSSSAGPIERGDSSYPDFEDIRKDALSFSGVASHQGRGAMLDTGLENKLVTVSAVSDNFFDVLRPRAAAGRLFTETELHNSGSLEVVLSYPFWRGQYNSDPGIVGRTIVVDRHPVTVVGVLPRSFRGTESLMVRDLWIPMSTFLQIRGERDKVANRKFRAYELFGRLKDGVSVPQARAELSAIAARLSQAYPASNAGANITAVPESQTRGEESGRTALILLGVAALVLLIACSNVSSLLVARIEYRRQEIATRLALGANRVAIVRQWLMESLVLAVMGTAAALALGSGLLFLLPRLMPQMSFSVGVDAYLSSRGWVAASGIALLALFLFGAVPAILASGMAPAGELKQRGSQASKVRPTMRNVLVISQVALSLVLVVGAGLLVRSVLKGLALDPGFNAHQNMLVLEVAPRLGNPEDEVHFVREARQRLEALPGVSETAGGMRIPFGMSGSGATHKVFVTGSLAGADRDGVTINFDPVADHFFDVLGTRILRGRAIDAHDLETNARVIVVNQQMASRFWPNSDPVGKRLRLEKMDGEEYEVIGVAEDGKYNDFLEDPMPYFFLPMQAEDYSEVSMAIKTTADPSTLAGPVRQTLRDVNRNVTIVNMVTLRQHIGEALYYQRIMAGLITALGTLGLLLAAVGMFGLMSFLVRRRTQEIGIRMALGAQRSGIFRLILAHALTLTAIGLLTGGVAAIATTRFLRALLVGVAPTDLVAFALGVAVLLAVTLAAAFTPAVTATRVDPMVALRCE